MDWQLILPLSSLIAGLTATPHCVLMCGPLFTIFSQKYFFYQLGRVIGYTSLGSLLGFVSLGVDLSGYLVSIQHLSVVLVILLFLASVVLYTLPMWPRVHQHKMGIQSKLLSIRKKIPIHTSSGALASGILSVFLPCGVLIPLWALCAVSGSPVASASISFGFVLGTIPGSLLFRVLLHKKWWNTVKIHKGLKIAGFVLLFITGVGIIGFRGIFAPYIHPNAPTANDKTGNQCLPFHQIND